MSIRDIFFLIFVIYIIFTITCTFRILFRAGFFESFYDFQHKVFSSSKALFNLNWNTSMFPNIDSNDKMLKFVVFSQKKAPYIIIAAFILISLLPDRSIILL